MKKIKVGKDKYAIVDNEDFSFLNRVFWRVNKDGYARTTFQVKSGVRKDITMHRLILNPYTENQIDHINNDRLDNRRQNLRVCLLKENVFNRSKGKGKSSQYKGVGRYKRTGQWQARICFEGKLMHLGMFEKEEDAAEAYNKAAKKYFGKYAWLNFRSAQ